MNLQPNARTGWLPDSTLAAAMERDRRKKAAQKIAKRKAGEEYRKACRPLDKWPWQ